MPRLFYLYSNTLDWYARAFRYASEDLTMMAHGVRAYSSLLKAREDEA